MQHKIISQKENKNLKRIVLTTWGSILGEATRSDKE